MVVNFLLYTPLLIMNTLAQGQRVNEIDLVTLVETGSFDPNEKIVFCTYGIEDFERPVYSYSIRQT
jgi:hypothetical protein